MADAVGCRLDRISAIAPVAGTYGPNWAGPCETSNPIPVVAFHGLADPIVPYEGGPIVVPETGQVAELPPVIAVGAWAAEWATHNGCAAQPETQPAVGEVEVLVWDDCDADVHLYAVGGGGHTWPGSPWDEPATNRDVSATDLIWEFFSATP